MVSGFRVVRHLLLFWLLLILVTVQSNSTDFMEAEGVCVCPLPLKDWGRLRGMAVDTV